MRICVYGASSKTIDKKYIEQSEALCEFLAKKGHTLVFGGGGNGLMGAAARGFEKGGSSEIISIAPKFFDVDGILFPRCTQYIYPETMRERKQLMENYAEAFVVLPGGIGTLDEFFEIITLRSLGRHNKPVALFNCDGFYDSMQNMLCEFEQKGFVRLLGDSLYGCFTDFEELEKYLCEQSGEYFTAAMFKDIK